LAEKKSLPSIWKWQKNNVKIVACGFQKFHINPQDIPKQIEIVPNGILYNFQLQKWVSKYHIVIRRKLF
jgi:intracellular sulfur oxidation DsrE/DsrF family protein